MAQEFTAQQRGATAVTEPAVREAEAQGERLDAGLAADQAWREERQEKLRRKLRFCHRLHTAARRGCVIAGLLEILFVVLFLVARAGANQAAGVGAIAAGAAFVGLLGISGASLPVIAWQRRRLLKDAERNAVSLPHPPAAPISLEGEEAGSERDERSVRLQAEVNQIFADERSLTGICSWGGYSMAAVWAFLVVGTGLTWVGALVNAHLSLPGTLFAIVVMIVGYVLFFITSISLIFMLFAAPGSSICAHRRKRLLREAARLGYALQDPARYSGE